MYVYADFNNRDPDGYLRLNTAGTVDGLAGAMIVLHEGLRIEVSDGDLVATIVVRQPGDENVWRGEVVGDVLEAHGDDGVHSAT